MKKIFMLVFIFCLALTSTAIAKGADFDTSDGLNKSIIPVEVLNDYAVSNGLAMFKSGEIPTIIEVNQALRKLNVSRDNPQQIIPLKNGFTIKATVSGEVGDPISINAETTYPVTASGKIELDAMGITWYTLSISESYTYNASNNKIVTWQDPPSLNPTGFLGWDAEETGKSIADLDVAAKDAIGDATYKYFKIAGNVSGHIELRFTATGNYFLHDSEFR